MNKIFVLDTNVLLDDPYSIFKFEDNKVVIPAIVLEELDSKKRQLDEVGTNARTFSNLIDKLRQEYPNQLNEGVPLENGGTLQIELNHVSFEKMKKYFEEKKNDNRILAVALNLHEEEKSKHESERREVVLVTQDVLAGVKADTLGIHVEKYENERLVDSLDHVHKGYHEVLVDPQIITDFYRLGKIDFELVKDRIKVPHYIQDFIILKDENGTNHEATGRLLMENEKLVLKKLYLAESFHAFGIRHKNPEQKMLMELLMDKKVELVIVMGPAGTGKTLLTLAAALEQVEEMNLYKKTFATRPIVPVGKDIGFLPGEKEEKLRPWMQPIYDNLELLFEKETIKKDKQRKEKETQSQKNKGEREEKEREKSSIDKIVEGLSLEIEALTYIRGRTLPGQFVIFDEGQNAGRILAKTMITRLGENSKMILLGDPDQVDMPYLDSVNNALVYVAEKMKHLPNVGVIRLKKTERSSLAEQGALLL